MTAARYAVDLSLRGITPVDFGDRARRVEELGYDGAFSTESVGDPFLSIAVAAAPTERIRLGTGVALAFTRSPMSMAYSAWDLQRLSGGRFVLGLGSQVKPHIVRRYSGTWTAPARRMGEYVRALRAIWEAWQTAGELCFEGDHYRHTLMPPNFRPAPLDAGPPPIHLAAVRDLMLATAAEVADGIVLHPFLTPEHLRAAVIPAIDRGLARAGRQREELEVTYALFPASDEREWEAARRRVAFYGSTPAYRGVLETHGEGELADRLHAMSRKGDWDAMTALVDDDLLERFCLRIGEPSAAAAELDRRLGGLVDRIAFNGGLDADEAALAPLAQALR